MHPVNLSTEIYASEMSWDVIDGWQLLLLKDQDLLVNNSSYSVDVCLEKVLRMI